jgi:YbbR domain-containing protein
MKALARALTHNWPLKLTSLGLGVLLWLVVLMRTNPWTVREFEVQVDGWRVPQGLQVLSINPPTVAISLAGRRNRVNRVDPDHVRVRASLYNREPGEHSVTAQVSTGTLPRGVQVLDEATHSVVVTLDRTVEQQRAVKIVARGRLAPGFQLVSSRARPNEVKVTGPQTRVRDVATAVAEVDVSGVQETTTFTCLLDARDARNMPVNGVRLDPARSDVEFRVQRVNTRTLPVVLGDITVPPGQTVESISVSPPVVTVTGTPAPLAALQYVRTKPITFAADTTEVRADLDLPEGLKPVGDDSVRVSVQLGGRATPTVTRAPARPAPEPEETAPEEPTPSGEEEPTGPQPEETSPAEPEAEEPADEAQPGGISTRPKPPGGDTKPTPKPD